jgi:glycosyltransferase involved in cell wall biosynthesis
MEPTALHKDDNVRMNRCYTILYHHRTQALDGQRVHIREIQDALRADGHRVVEVSVLKSDERAGAVAKKSALRWFFDRVQAIVPLWARELMEYSYNAFGTVAVLRAALRERPDFIYERYALHTVAGVWVARCLRVPLLLEVNSPLAAERDALMRGRFRLAWLSHVVERYILRRATRVLAVSRVLADAIAADAGLDPAKIEVIHNGVDLQRFTATSNRASLPQALVRTNRVIAGAVAFFLPWHGIDRLLRIIGGAPRLRNRLTLLLIGDGPAIPELRKLAADYGLGDTVHFYGTVPHDEIPGVLSAIDIAVIPRAVSYASPLKLFEYMAAGKAIVAPRQANVLEVAREGAEILCFSPDDVQTLEQHLTTLVDNAAERERLGEAARARLVHDERTWRANARRIVDVFETTSGLAPGLASARRPAAL